jgi:hypothetical protein
MGCLEGSGLTVLYIGKRFLKVKLTRPAASQLKQVISKLRLGL